MSCAAGGEGESSSTELAGLRAELLRANTVLLEVLEGLDHLDAQAFLDETLTQELAHAGQTLEALKPWDLLPERSFRTYTRGPNHVRLRRLLDFVHAGDRVLDIGVGYGYVTSMLLRERALKGYCGVDLADRFLKATAQGLSANGLAQRPAQLEILNLYDLTPEFVNRHSPNLVILLEVLEHLPDAEQAFKTLGDTIAGETDLLFTVPMHRRLESVWGHRSIFDLARLRRLCRTAGLTLHHCEPLHNVWMLAVASQSPEISSRVLQAARPQPPSGQPQPRVSGYRFVDVDLTDCSITTGPGIEAASASMPKEGIACLATGRQAAVELHVSGLGLLRWEATFARPEIVEMVTIAGFDEGGNERVTWQWVAADGPALTPRRQTYVLRAGESRSGFRGAGRPEDAASVRRLRITCEVKAEGEAMRIHRLAYVSAEH